MLIINNVIPYHTCKLQRIILSDLVWKYLKIVENEKNIPEQKMSIGIWSLVKCEYIILR